MDDDPPHRPPEIEEPPESRPKGGRDESDREVRPVSVASLPWEEAWLMAGRLRAEGVPARVYPDDYASPIVGAQFLPAAADVLAQFGLGRTSFDVMVPNEFEAASGEIVARYVRPR